MRGGLWLCRSVVCGLSSEVPAGLAAVVCTPSIWPYARVFLLYVQMQYLLLLAFGVCVTLGKYSLTLLCVVRLL